MAAVRGEWWIDDRGDSHFADIDTGDVGHEALAYCSALGLPLDDLSDYDGPEFEVGQQLTPELVKYLRDQGTAKDAIAFFSQPHQDAREFMLLHRNWIRVKGDNFEVGKFNADALKRIRNFEGWDDDAEDSAGAVWIEERAAEPEWLANEGRWSNQGWYGQVPIRALLGTATVAELRAEYGTRQNPARRTRRNPARSAPASRREALARFITECGEAVHRAGLETAAGNCGMYAIGLSEFLLRHTNLKPTISFLLADSDEVPGGEVDHTHVFVDIGGEPFDGNGHMGDLELLGEVWDLHDPFVSAGWDPRNERTTRRHVRGDTDWDTDWEDYYEVLVDDVRVPVALKPRPQKK